MPFGPDRPGWYLDGVRRAEQDGLIAYTCEDADKLSASDHYRHIAHGEGAAVLLKYTNTRPLSLVARQLLGLYGDEPGARLLELGPGAGVACATMNRLLPRAKIDTVSLTPLNPYVRFNSDCVYDRIEEPFLDERLSLSFYAASGLPFVHNQYIGKFPDEIGLPNQNYHFIYENYGPLYYNFQPNENDEPMALARTAMAAARSLLRADGTMLIMASDGWYRMEDLLESAALDTDMIVICKRMTGWHPFPCIVARNGSPLARRLRMAANGLLAQSERVLRLEYHEFENVISRMCGLFGT
jgi:hypothetical protein